MDLFMKVNGEMIGQTVVDDSSMKMENISRVTSEMIGLMVKVLIIIMMVLYTQETSKTINQMGEVKKLMLMDLPLQGNLSMEIKDTGNLLGKMDPNIWANIKTMSCMEQGNMNGLMVEDMKVLGATIKCTEKAHSSSQMEGHM